MDNALTIDVEDYYMVSAFADQIKFDDWRRYESRVERNTYRILDLLGEYRVQGTFFILGWVAENCPELVRTIHASGHEVACHGYNHRLIYDLTPAQFKEDTKRAKAVLEDTAGTAVKGYRATSYSIVKETLWALDILLEEGFSYDSSIFPVHHDRYGIPGAQRFPHVMKKNGGELMEFPPTTYRVFGQNVPVAGGGYLRLYPLPITKVVMETINTKEKQPVIVYFHPWEIDEGQPRLNGKWKSKFRHYVNLKTTLPKLECLLKNFTFKRMNELGCAQ